MLTDEEIDEWEPTTVLTEELENEGTDDTKADDQ